MRKLVIDPMYLDELRTLQQVGKPDLVVELVDIYLEAAPGRIAAMRLSAANNDFIRLEREAHSLKSSSQCLGALELGSICLIIEKLAAIGEIDFTDHLKRLEESFQKVVEALRKEKTKGVQAA